MKRWHVVLSLLWVVGFGSARGPAQEPAGSPAEIMHIDGAKNPELIPQWSAWGFAFRVFAGGFRQLPSSMIPHVTSAEHALILKESDSVQKIDAACLERHRKILAARAGKTLEELDKEVRELNLDCRGETLHARDRLLATISPEAQAALTAYVESTKAGTTFSIARKDLPRFREPE